MATKGERSDVPAPWGAWLAFGVAMVCSGGLPAVVTPLHAHDDAPSAALVMKGWGLHISS